MRKATNRVRITAQRIRAAEDVYAWSEDSAGLAQAETLLKQATAIGATYAPAWNLLGMVYSRHPDIGEIAWETGDASAREAIQIALELDPDYADAHASLGWRELMHQRDLTAAARHYSKALALQPGNGEMLEEATLLALVCQMRRSARSNSPCWMIRRARHHLRSPLHTEGHAEGANRGEIRASNGGRPGCTMSAGTKD